MPVSLALLFFTAIVDKLIPSGTNVVLRMAIHLTLNILIAAVTLEILRRRGRQNRLAMNGGDGPGGRELLHDEHDAHGHAEPAHSEPEAHGGPLGAREPITVPVH